MSDNETMPELTMEDKLKAIAYQFVALYERWSEDRQVAAKQGADTAELVKLFTEQVKGFKELESHVRQNIINSIREAAISSAKKISEEVSKEVAQKTDDVVDKLKKVTYDTEKALKHYEKEIVTTDWKIIGVSAFTTVITSLFLVWLIMPKPTLPLTDQQIKLMNSGIMMQAVWPKLSKEEQHHWEKLADRVAHPPLATDPDSNADS